MDKFELITWTKRTFPVSDSKEFKEGLKSALRIGSAYNNEWATRFKIA